MEDEKQSNWNEQQAFARLYFYYTNLCRINQNNVNLIAWERSLSSKISLIMGVSDKKEKETLINYVTSIKNGIIKLNGPSFRENSAILHKNLFLTEAEVDTIAHQHMPFLNLKKKLDLGGL